MSQIKKKFLKDGSVDGAKILFLNEQALKGRNAADTADISLFKVNAFDRLEFLTLPQVSSDPVLADDVVRKSHLDTEISGVEGDVSALAGRVEDLEEALAQPNGIATLDSNGLVPTSQLPSYVDDVLEFASLAAFPDPGQTGKIYIALDTNKTYRWGGSVYVQITSGAVDSVNGQTGIVSLDSEDVAESGDARYYTAARQTAIEGYADQAEADAISAAQAYTDAEIEALLVPMAQHKFVDYASGSDSTGNGSQLKPWKTVSYACSQITDASNSKRYVIEFDGIGLSTEVVVLPQFVMLKGQNISTSNIQGTVQSTPTTSATNVTILNCTINKFELDSTACTSGQSTRFFNCYITTYFRAIGRPIANNQTLFFNSDIATECHFKGGQLTVVGSAIHGRVRVYHQGLNLPTPPSPAVNRLYMLGGTVISAAGFWLSGNASMQVAGVVTSPYVAGGGGVQIVGWGEQSTGVFRGKVAPWQLSTASTLPAFTWVSDVTMTIQNAASAVSLTATADPVVQTGSITSGSDIISGLASTASIKVGYILSGSLTGIPANATVTEIISGSSVRMSANATQTRASLNVTASPTLKSLIADWNAANPSNLIALTVGNDLQIVQNGTEIPFQNGLVPSYQPDATTYPNEDAPITGGVRVLPLDRPEGIRYDDRARATYFGFRFYAVNYGASGNSIALVFTGSNTIAQAVTTWNTANPLNAVTYTDSGDGQNVLLPAATVQLSGGGLFSGSSATFTAFDAIQQLGQKAKDLAAADVAMQALIDALEAASVEFVQQKFVLSAGDIAAGYIDLAHLAITASISPFVDRLAIHETDDYIVSVIGGVTRLTFAGSLIAGGDEQLAAGDVIRVKYAKRAIA